MNQSEKNEVLTPVVTVDTTGLVCPEPVMMLHQAVRKAQSGDSIKVIATDPATTRDIPKFCMHLGHKLLSQQMPQPISQPSKEDVYIYLIEKK